MGLDHKCSLQQRRRRIYGEEIEPLIHLTEPQGIIKKGFGYFEFLVSLKHEP